MLPTESMRIISPMELDTLIQLFEVPQFTDPHIMQVLLNEYELSNLRTSHAFFSNFLSQASSRPMDLRPIIENVKGGILANEPIAAFAKDLYEILRPLSAHIHSFDPQFLATVKNTLSDLIHTILILEMCTVSMCNSSDFAKDIVTHFIQFRQKSIPTKQSTLAQNFVHMTQEAGTFIAVKLQSVEPGLWSKICLRPLHGKLTQQEADQFFRENPVLNVLDKHIIQSNLGSPSDNIENSFWGLKLNILEAMHVDKENTRISGQSNAIAGFSLIKLLESVHTNSSFVPLLTPVLPKFTPSIEQLYSNYTNRCTPNDLMKRNDGAYKVHLRQDWIDCYIAWNLGFVANNVDFPEISFAKLLIPSVLSAHPDNWLESRLYSLWLVVMLHLVLNTKRKSLNDRPPKFPFSFQKPFIEKFGEINKNYGSKILKDYLGWSQKNFETMSSAIIKPGYLQTIRMLYNSIGLGNVTKETQYKPADHITTWQKVSCVQYKFILLKENSLICMPHSPSLREKYFGRNYQIEVFEAWRVFLNILTTKGLLLTEIPQELLDAAKFQAPLTSRFVHIGLTQLELKALQDK